MNRIKTFKQFLFEKNTSEYEPPKHLVSPALDPETQEPDDKMYDYMRGELDKTTKYFEPSISSIDEKIKGDSIECDNCGWTWEIKEGGSDLFVCHECGHDNLNKVNI